MEEAPPQAASIFGQFATNLVSSSEQDDLEMLDKWWEIFRALHDKVQYLYKLYHDDAESGDVAATIKSIHVTGETIVSDLDAAKMLIDRGYFGQSLTLLRPAMELGLKLSILVVEDKVVEWKNGEQVIVNIDENTSKGIEDCIYGELISSMEHEIDLAKEKFLDDQFESREYAQLISVLKGFRDYQENTGSSVKMNDLIHKTPELVNFRERFFDMMVSCFAGDEEAWKEQFGGNLLDVVFQSEIPLVKALARQTMSRFVELMTLQSRHNLPLSEETLEEEDKAYILLRSSINEFEEESEPYIDKWRDKSGDEVSL